MSPINYLKWISEKFPGYVGNWPPTRSLTLGSVGTLGPNGFDQRTIIHLQPQKSYDGQLSVIEHAQIAPGVTSDSELNISFEDEHAFIIQATNFSGTTAADLTTVKAQVAAKLKNGDWDSSWYVVVGLQLASVATIIVSESKDASLVLNGTVGSPLPLANDAQLNISSQKKSSISFLTAGYPILMYRALKLKDAWLLRATTNIGSSPGPFQSQRNELPEMDDLKLEDVLSFIK